MSHAVIKHKQERIILAKYNLDKLPHAVTNLLVTLFGWPLVLMVYPPVGLIFIFGHLVLMGYKGTLKRRIKKLQKEIDIELLHNSKKPLNRA